MDTSDEIQKATELRARLTALYKRDQFEIHDKVLVFHDKLKKKYSDYLQCRLYHLISGSTMKTPYVRFDYPGEDSIEQFILREYDLVFGPDRASSS